MSTLRRQVLILYRARLWRHMAGYDTIEVSFEGALTRMAR